MYNDVTKNIKLFSEKYLSRATNKKKAVIEQLIGGFILSEGKKTFSGFCRFSLSFIRNKTSVRIFFQRRGLDTKELLSNCIKSILPENKTNGVYTILFDGTCVKRGAESKIKNALKYREKVQNKKGIRSTKSHTFLMGLLICPNGLRIPFRKTYYTKDFCNENKMIYKTQHELAIEMLEEIRELLGKRANIIAVADGFFDSKRIFIKCNKLNITYITTADSARVCIVKSKKNKLYKRGLKFIQNFKNWKIIKGDETYVKTQIRSSLNISNKHIDKYRTKSEIQNLSGIEKMKVVYSWKKMKRGKQSYKVLLCNNSNLSELEIIEYYSLRWQIEIFFRELKSDLGFSDYTGKDFYAYEKFIDICLLSFIFIEWARLDKIDIAKARKEKSKFFKIRTRGMIHEIKKDAIRESISQFMLKKAA